MVSRLLFPSNLQIIEAYRHRFHIGLVGVENFPCDIALSADLDTTTGQLLGKCIRTNTGLPAWALPLRPTGSSHSSSPSLRRSSPKPLVSRTDMSLGDVVWRPFSSSISFSSRVRGALWRRSIPCTCCGRGRGQARTGCIRARTNFTVT